MNVAGTLDNLGPGRSRILRESFTGDVPVWRQLGPNEVRRVGTPCMIGVTLDIDELLKRLGEKALKSKGKRATAFHGALVVQVKEMDEPTPSPKNIAAQEMER